MSEEHVPDEASRYLVKTAAGFCTQEQISRLLRISVGTLKKYYEIELELGHIEKIRRIAETQFEIATNPDNKSCAAVGMWWLERRGGDDWKPAEKRLKIEGSIDHNVKPTIDSTKLTYEQRQKMRDLLLDIESSQKLVTQDNVVAEQDKED